MENKNFIPHPQVKSIRELEFDKFSIPSYQRPYKWTAKNVNQLISDLVAFRGKSQYRLGTLVLHENNQKLEIVDGQQRIITLALILKIMLQSISDDEKVKKENKPLSDSLDVFAQKNNFENQYSLFNIVENIHVIENRKAELDNELLDFIINKCQFVVISLTDISEAFQFFDSQNARGKDLAPHDLLKAYHLREMDNLSSSDVENINNWQGVDTKKLHNLFLTLYRAKNWSVGNSALYFTKDNIDDFKGISLKNGVRYPFYQMEIVAHVFSQIYNNDPLRGVDQKTFEYPFNLDDQIVNGSRFFDMISHYQNLYENINKLEIKEDSIAKRILEAINDYNGMKRNGDQYVRNLFNTILLYYIDRFDYAELDKVIPKFFIWAYQLRLTLYQVKYVSIDIHAIRPDSMFRSVHMAKTPYDIINITQKSLEGNEVKVKTEKIYDLFVELKKITK